MCMSVTFVVYTNTFQVDELLFQICTPPGVTNRAGDTLLSVASAGGHLDTVRYLVEVHHCDPKRELISV